MDEETHHVVAILHGQDGITLKEWLKQNKQVTIVTQDRANSYTKAIKDFIYSF